MMKEQIGWYAPDTKRFCYLDEKEVHPKLFKAYWIPVFIETFTLSSAKAA